MGQFAMPILIASTVASGAVAAKASIDAGKAAANEAKLQARREGDAARSREIERKRRLLQSLASQSAQAAAYGASPDLSVAAADIKYAQEDALADLAGVRTEQSLLRARGRNARRAGYYSAAGSLLDTASGAATLKKT